VKFNKQIPLPKQMKFTWCYLVPASWRRSIAYLKLGLNSNALNFLNLLNTNCKLSVHVKRVEEHIVRDAEQKLTVD
jgi:hypothetical protein